MTITKTEKRPDMPRAKQLIDQNAVLKSENTNFESYWQSLHDYFYIESQDINRSYFPGTELTIDTLYDSTTLEAADVLASGFMNYLTPPTSKWFNLTAKEEGLRDNKKIAKFLGEVAEQVDYTFNKSNFYNQMFTMYKGSGVYGTSCMIEEEDVEEDARFTHLPIKNARLLEDGKGRVVGYFLDFEFTAQQAETRWGIDKLRSELRAELAKDVKQQGKHKFLLYIGKRHVRDITKSNRENLPIESVWVDVEGRVIIDEGGYNEFPAFCHRFDKRPTIPFGFSPAMKALPFARILNAAAKTNLRAMMKQTDPPIAVPDNAFMLPFNANPRAVNYYQKAKMQGGAKDIFSFGNFGDMNAGLNSVEYYADKVRKLMFNDVFLAFDRITKQMNNPEIMERINEKMTLLGPAVGRYTSEVIHPVIIRTIGILYRRGKLPEPPDEFRANPEYEINITSQLAQAQRRTQLNSLMTGLSLVGEMANFAPEVLDKVNADEVVDEAWEIIGAPARVLRDDAEVQKIREAKARMAQEQSAMEMTQQGADVIEKGSKVDLNLAKAGEAGKK